MTRWRNLLRVKVTTREVRPYSVRQPRSEIVHTSTRQRVRAQCGNSYALREHLLHLVEETP